MRKCGTKLLNVKLINCKLRRVASLLHICQLLIAYCQLISALCHKLLRTTLKTATVNWECFIAELINCSPQTYYLRLTTRGSWLAT